MKNLSLYFLFALSVLPIFVKAQFQAGQSFVSGGFSLNLNDNKYKGPNYSNQSAGYQQNISLNLGHFTQNNKAVGWTLDHSLNTVKNTNPANTVEYPSNLRYLGFGISRFVEYYKPISEKFALFIQPSVGLNYGLNNDYNGVTLNDGTYAFSTSKTNTISLGVSFEAGIAWRITPKWALYGSFAFSNPINVSGGWKNTENPRQDSPQGGPRPQGGPLKTEGGFFKYNLSPTLNSGGIGLGFRYFYTRNKSNS